MSIKLCPHCGKEKPYSEYYMRGDYPGQPRWVCKVCYNEILKEHKILKELEEAKKRGEQDANINARSFITSKNTSKQ